MAVLAASCSISSRPSWAAASCHEEARQLFESIPTDNLVGLRDRALIGVLIYSFARISAALSMRVEDYFPQGKRWWLRLHEKGGKHHEMPVHHSLEEHLDQYVRASGMAKDKKGWLFRAALARNGGLSERPMLRRRALEMIYRRAKAAGSCREVGGKWRRRRRFRLARPRRNPRHDRGYVSGGHDAIAFRRQRLVRSPGEAVRLQVRGFIEELLEEELEAASAAAATSVTARRVATATDVGHVSWSRRSARWSCPCRVPVCATRMPSGNGKASSFRPTSGSALVPRR